jgi:uncharacterized membrane protein
MKINVQKLGFLLFSLLSFSCIFLAHAQDTTDKWEIEIVKQSTNEVVKSGLVNTNSFPLDGLESNVEYFARIRTCNTFLSGWAISEVFTVSPTTAIAAVRAEIQIHCYTNGAFRIVTELARQIDIYSAEGGLYRSFFVKAGETTLTNFKKGIYIVNGRKIIIK